MMKKIKGITEAVQKMTDVEFLIVWKNLLS